MSKLVIALGDMHCGHRAGLMTPEHYEDEDEFPHIYKIQREMYERYRAFTEEYKRPDLVAVNADCIDGKGEKSGGCEQWTTDRRKQALNAVKLLKMWNAKKYIITYGTGYHEGNAEDWAEIISDELECEIHSHCQFEIEGVIFDMKHHCGNSTMPHTKGTPITREMIFNLLWADAGACEKADIIMRSHVHNYFHTDSVGWDAFTLPALQAPGTKFGSRRCSGLVHWGILPFKVNKGEFTWTKKHIIQLEAARSKLIKL